MDLTTVRARLQRYQPAKVEHNGYQRAAVAMILRERGHGCEVLLIQRSERPHDPWSGHMAFPGGRHDPEDADLIRTATRETHEEVGIDLTRTGHLIGHLDDLQAIAHSRPLGLIIRPYVYALASEVEPAPDQREVRATVWMPLAHLTRAEAAGTYTYGDGGSGQQFPAFVYQGYTIWGLTHRMLSGFLELMR
ncbi:MAG: CoA pyrophosphatase [Deltaproteobacteria bacterium]|nr:CoA pyrophosphatase [Deltaproteobacteria bacterium]